MMPKLPAGCLTPDCRSVAAAFGKGLCIKCYSTAKKLVESGKVTWEKLAELGMIESKSDPFASELDRLLKSEGE